MRVEAAKTKVAVLNSPKDVPCMPCLREQGFLTPEIQTSWMLVTNDLNTKGFHCKENPNHKEEVHKLIRNTWICCDDVNVVPEK